MVFTKLKILTRKTLHMSENKQNSGLNLSEDGIKKEPEATLTPEQIQIEAARTMGAFYNTVGNCALNLVAILEHIRKSLEDASNDSASLLELEAKRALKDDIITQVEFEEMMAPEEEEPPANSEKS